VFAWLPHTGALDKLNGARQQKSREYKKNRVLRQTKELQTAGKKNQICSMDFTRHAQVKRAYAFFF